MKTAAVWYRRVIRVYPAERQTPKICDAYEQSR